MGQHDILLLQKAAKFLSVAYVDFDEVWGLLLDAGSANYWNPFVDETQHLTLFFALIDYGVAFEIKPDYVLLAFPSPREDYAGEGISEPALFKFEGIGPRAAIMRACVHVAAIIIERAV